MPHAPPGCSTTACPCRLSFVRHQLPSPSLLPSSQKLALERLLATQLLPYARAAAGTLPAAADRAARLAAALPPEWFLAGAPPPRGAEGLLELLRALAKGAEAAAGDADWFAANQAVARQLSAALIRLGDSARGNAVAQAYGVL